MQGSTRIGILIPEFPGQTHIFFWREIEALRSCGADVKIISTRKPGSENFHEFHNQVGDTFYLTTLPVLRILLFFVCNISWLLRSLSYCFKLHGGLRTKLRTTLFIPFSANLIMYCRKHHINHMHVHSSADAAHIVSLAGLSNEFTYSICVHGNLNQYGDNHAAKFRKASFIVTVTNPLSREVSSVLPDIPSSRIPVIPMGVDIEKFRPRAHKNQSSPNFVITSVSRLAHVKGHSFALQALAKLPNSIRFRYNVVGDGDMREALEKEAKDLGIADKVEFFGFQKEGEVYEILQQTDIFMLTSFGYGEAAPVAIMEAMACGVTPICSIIGGTTDMITDRHDGTLVKQKDVNHITEALMYLLSDRDRLQEISMNARKTAETKFCHRRSAYKLLEHIQSVHTI